MLINNQVNHMAESYMQGIGRHLSRWIYDLFFIIQKLYLKVVGPQQSSNNGSLGP